MDARDYPEAYLDVELEPYGTKNHVLDKAAKEIKRLRQQLADMTAYADKRNTQALDLERQLSEPQAPLDMKPVVWMKSVPATTYYRTHEAKTYFAANPDEDGVNPDGWEPLYTESQLIAMTQKAGEVMRQRFVVVLQGIVDEYDDEEVSATWIETGIRALPGVTMEDLQG